LIRFLTLGKTRSLFVNRQGSWGFHWHKTCPNLSMLNTYSFLWGNSIFKKNVSNISFRCSIKTTRISKETSLLSYRGNRRSSFRATFSDFSVSESFFNVPFVTFLSKWDFEKFMEFTLILRTCSFDPLLSLLRQNWELMSWLLANAWQLYWTSGDNLLENWRNRFFLRNLLKREFCMRIHVFVLGE